MIEQTAFKEGYEKGLKEGAEKRQMKFVNLNLITKV